jgi:hypothetical protein
MSGKNHVIKKHAELVLELQREADALPFVTLDLRVQLAILATLTSLLTILGADDE